MKKLLLSRRGAAIELAMAVIFLMMALCIILVSVATLQKSQRQKDLNDLDNKIELMQITDSIINDPPTENKDLGNGYFVTVEEDKYIVTEGEKVVLTIVIDDDGNITSWN